MIDIEHGTSRGYDQHQALRKKNPAHTACQPCRDAKAAYLRRYRAETGRAKSIRVSHETVALLAHYAPQDIVEKLVEEIGMDRYEHLASIHTPGSAGRELAGAA